MRELSEFVSAVKLPYVLILCLAIFLSIFKISAVILFLFTVRISFCRRNAEEQLGNLQVNMRRENGYWQTHVH